MEKRLSHKIEKYQVDFKNAIKKWMDDTGCRIISNKNSISDSIKSESIKSEIDKTNDFLMFMYDYDGFSLTKDDFQKRKRIKNIVPHDDRCVAKRANGEQCSRRKNDDSTLCGTHSKGTPHGLFLQEGGGGHAEEHKEMKVQVWVEDIKGIHQYIDANHNVYQSEDIISNKKNPKVISKWKKEEGVYSIE
jgi:hypothetical protein